MHKISGHTPVLSQSVKAFLRPSPGKIFVDATLGLGGHASLLLQEGAHIIGFDADNRNLELAKKALSSFQGKITFIHENFRFLGEVLRELKIATISGVLFDLGVSSVHFDDALRGFSFRSDGPLDMRYDERQKKTAFDLINRLSEKSLADLFYHYGEERGSRRIAAVICSERRKHPIRTTRELAELVERISSKHERIHPATRVFQALRIAVNDELLALKEALPQAISALESKGRIVVLSYHSLEDRIVKEVFRTFSRQKPPVISLLTKKPLTPSVSEIQENPRARSAKLRAAEKI